VRPSFCHVSTETGVGASFVLNLGRLGTSVQVFGKSTSKSRKTEARDTDYSSVVLLL
jgi:hypothetical protein